MTSDIVGLAERCEKATGPDRELDAAVWLHLPDHEGHAWKHGGDKFAHARQIAGCAFVPRYTASLDAAMTLVPEGCSWNISTQWPNGFLTHVWKIDPDMSSLVRNCATPALALCAAALRARATLSGSPEG